MCQTRIVVTLMTRHVSVLFPEIEEFCSELVEFKHNHSQAKRKYIQGIVWAANHFLIMYWLTEVGGSCSHEVHTVLVYNKCKTLRVSDDKWKSLRLDLLEVDRMTALIHYEHQRWKKVNVFAKKPLPRSLFQHVQTLCMPSFIDLHTRATPGHVTSFACM